MGNWHDWLTLTQTAAKRLGDVNQSSLVAALHNVTGGKFRQAVAALSTSPTIPKCADACVCCAGASAQAWHQDSYDRGAHRDCRLDSSR